MINLDSGRCYFSFIEENECGPCDDCIDEARELMTCGGVLTIPLLIFTAMARQNHLPWVLDVTC